MMELGTEIPSFSLPDVRTGKMVRVPDTGQQGAPGPILVMFICRHCPYVIHVKNELARIGRDYAGKVAIIAISSNDAGYVADDSPEKLKEMAEELSSVQLPAVLRRDAGRRHQLHRGVHAGYFPVR